MLTRKKNEKENNEKKTAQPKDIYCFADQI